MAEAQSRNRPTPRRRATKPATQPAAPQPAPEPETGPATLGRVARELARLPRNERTPEKLALQAGLEFMLAVSAADGDRAVRWLDATGYQPLPIEGPLPDPPGKPVLAPEIAAQIKSRPAAPIAGLPPEAVAALRRADVAARFASVGQWMLPGDFGVVFESVHDPREPPWLPRDALVVVRVRGVRATVMGGNLLETLSAGVGPAKQPDEP